jgi:transcriptional regulator with XRE-family HTH domain
MSKRRSKPPSKPSLFPISRKIDLWLADQGMSLAELADRCGIKGPTLWRWIRAGTRMPASGALALAKATNMNVGYLLDELAVYPPSAAETRLEAIAKHIPDAEGRRLAPLLNDPAERRAWLAAWSARREGS